jgi:secreted PhoX family phosphatase
MSNSKLLDNAELHDLLEDIPTNRSGNTPFTEIAKRNLARRSVVKGTLAGAVAGFFAPAALAKGPSKARGKPFQPDPAPGTLVGFEPVSIAQGASDSTVPHISEDYEYQVLIPWGSPIRPGAPEYNGDPNTRPTPEEAAEQVGIGHDGMWFFPEDAKFGQFVKDGYQLSNRRGLLVVNHEYGTNPHVLGKDFPETLDDVRLSQHVHGVSVVAIRRKGNGEWKMVNDPANRRIHVNTPVEFSGPAAGSPLLENAAGNDPAGTVNNCGSGPTPWGTYITCEENFNGYFGSNGPLVRTPAQERYGFSEDGFDYGWHVFDERFDLNNSMYANEQHRFGWCVEIDPFDPYSKPIKRTAMGRVKHEAVAIKELEDGRIAAYMGDDQRFDYCYKYESNRPWKDAIADGESPLDDGRLYVARFDDNNNGEWIWLSVENPTRYNGKTLGEIFASQAELLVFTRLAADHVGATPMDRPEWTTIGKDGEVFWTLTNNDRRLPVSQGGPGPNVANPIAEPDSDLSDNRRDGGNQDGHIIKTIDDDNDPTKFSWDFFIFARDTRGTPGVFTDPDAAWADADGRLFIGTDGGQPDGLQDQLTVFDTSQNPPVPHRLFVGVASDEITGYATTPDYKTAFINMQHPGDGDPTRTNFPAPTDGVTIPRDCTIVITRKNGGVVGS